MYSDPIPQSLYIHIPFCTKKCSYCDFFSVTKTDTSVIESVLNQTIKQIQYFNNQYKIDSVNTIYIGGGTPGSIGGKLLKSFIEKLLQIYKTLPQEFTVEINPESANEYLFEVLQELPVTRVSIGIQSFDSVMLERLGRSCSAQNIYTALEMFKNRVTKNLNLDIISSIPGQTVNTAINDVKQAASFSPDHISLYYLTLEEGTPLSKKYSSKELDDECWLQASDYLYENGFNHYEISNYSKQNKKSLHNMSYWQMKPYIGAGPGAVSTIIKDKNFYRITTGNNIKLFTAGEENLWNMSNEKIILQDSLIEVLMMGFRTDEGICVESVNNFFKLDIEKLITPVIIKWQEKKMLEKRDKKLILTRDGRFFHTSFMLDILESLDMQSGIK